MSLRDDGKRNDERVSDFGRHEKFENIMGANRNEEDRSHGVDSKVRKAVLHFFIKCCGFVGHSLLPFSNFLHSTIILT